MALPLLDSERWRGAMASSFGGLRAVPTRLTPGPDVAGDYRWMPLDDIGVYGIWGTQQHLVRGDDMVRRNPIDLLKVCLMVRGRATIEQDGVEVTIGPGEFALYDTSRAYRITKHEAWQVSVMTVDRGDVGLTGARLRHLMGQPVAATGGPGQAFASYLRSLVGGPTVDVPGDVRGPRDVDALDGGARTTAAGAVGEPRTDLTGLPGGAVQHLRAAGIALLNAVLLDTLDEAAEAEPDLLADHVIAYIEANLHDPAMTLASVAAEHHLSARTLQRLLATRSTTFTALVRSRRLASIRRALADPQQSGRTISALAAGCGVFDQPWLSRAFRAEFGLSPSDFRRQAAAPGRPRWRGVDSA
ncbi:MAG: AraC family transcriptional regulator [Actinomycetales bacterium]